jgi:Zn-dependent protease with chaperone function
MIDQSQTTTRAPRLNPFAFPSDTSFRFVLLNVFVLCSSLAIYGVMWPAFYAAEDEAFNRCGYEWVQNLDFKSLDYLRSVSNLVKCSQPYTHSLAIFRIAGVVLLLGVAFGIYWLFPAWKIRHDGLRSLKSEDAPGVVACLDKLCCEVGLSPHPVFMWNPLNPTSNALAFGRHGRYYVAVTAGLIKSFSTDRSGFQAVVLHELAHLRNADVAKTYFTVSIWQAFVGTSLVPLGLSLFWHGGDWEAIFYSLWYITASTATVYLTRNAVLRARELYADVRASVWDGPSGSLGRVLQALPTPKHSRWRALLRVHPEPSARLHTLDNTHQLFPLGFWDAFGAGFAAMIAIESVWHFGLVFLTPEVPSFLILWEIGLLFGLPLLFLSIAVGAVGIGVWREAFAALMRGETPHDAGRLGVALALGILLGLLVDLVPAIFIGSGSVVSDNPTPMSAVVFLGGSMLLWMILLLASLFLIFKWVAAATSAWLEVVLHSPSPRLGLMTTLTIGSGMVILWFGTTFLLLAFNVYVVWHTAQIADVSTITREDFVTLLGVIGLLISLTLMGLWGGALAAWFWRRRAGLVAGSSWAFLDGPVTEEVLPRQTPLRPGLAVGIGFVVGLVFCALLAAMRLFHYMPPEVATWIRATPKVYVGYTLQGLAAVVQAAAAAIAASWISRLGALHGLFSAFIVGCVITTGWLLLFGAESVYDAFWTYLLFSMTGALIVLPTALGASSVADWSRRLKRTMKLRVST